MAVRREAFLAAGGFRVGFGRQGDRRPEDTEMCLRLAASSGGHWLYVPDAQIEHPVPVERTRLRAFLSRCYEEGRGKVEMARLLAGHASLESERTYLSRTLPRAVGRGLADAAHGKGMRHVAVAGATVLGVVAAGVGGGVEALRPARPETLAMRAPVIPQLPSSYPVEGLSTRQLPNRRADYGAVGAGARP
jgi:hypothetical protein